mgnify:CR=1 FL=1
MKKNNKINKIIILSIIALIFTISAVIFVLNYTKDISSFSILEKNWISNHTSSVIDVSVYNDVPVYGEDGEGIIFSYLEEFTKAYEIEFNKISYLTNNAKNLKDVAFKVVDYNYELTDNDIEMYRDYYVIVGKEEDTINDISDLKDTTLGVLDSDIANIRYFLNDGKDIKITTCKTFEDLLKTLDSEDVKYIAIPNNLYLDDILSNDLQIVFHISELYQKYILTISNDKTLKSIMSKYNIIYNDTYKDKLYKDYFLNTLFKYKKITEAEKMSYNANSYTYGYVTNMPFESTVNKEFVGTLSNYLSGFEDLANIDFKIVEYNNINDLKQALSHGEVDLIFANFATNGINVDVLETNSPFKEEYFVISTEPMVVNSVRSLKGKEIYTTSNTYLYDYLSSNGITTKIFSNTDELLRGIKKDSIIVIDRDTYEYYKDNKFKNYKIIYQNTLDNDYRFVIRDVNKNKTFYELFNYYVSSIDYNTIKYTYNTDYIVNSKNHVSNMIKYLLITLGTTLSLIILFFIILKIRTKKKNLNKDDKLKYIDVMTSLKNRNYLNYNIKVWEDNTIYPQSIVIIDLNNIKYINDNYGHAEGDEVIKKAASILINNQKENTDIVRTDGNEFLIYMVGYDEKKVIEYTRLLSKELKELPHEFGATLGYSMINDDIKTIDDAINEATLSMRQAKEKL